jgi:hypothetical protein
MAEGQIKIVFEPASDGLYKAVCIEDDKGNVLKGAWHDVRPWHQEHAVRILWEEESEVAAAELHRIMIDNKDVSDVLEEQEEG